MITPDQDTFHTELDSLRPAIRIADIGRLLPYSVVVKNVGNQAVAAVTIRYDITEVSGRQYYWIFMREGFSAGGRTSFRTGNAYLTTPSSRLNQAVWFGRDTNDPEIARDVVSTATDIGRFRSMAISLDSVIFTDGLVVGPDRCNSVGQFTAWVRAEQDLIREMQAGLANTDLEIITSLTKKREQPATHFEARDHYGRHQESLARVLLRALQTGGRGAFLVELEVLKNRPRVQLHR